MFVCVEFKGSLMFCTLLFSGAEVFSFHKKHIHFTVGITNQVLLPWATTRTRVVLMLHWSKQQEDFTPLYFSASVFHFHLILFLSSADTFCIFFRFAHVSHHSNHPGPVLCHWQLCDAEAPLDARVHSHLHPVFCQVLHHRCDCVGGGRAGGAAAGCHHLPGVFCQGEQCHMLYVHCGILFYWLLL